jgi:hypothetical protein
MVLPHRCPAVGAFPLQQQQQQQRGVSSRSGAGRGAGSSRLPGTSLAAVVLASTVATATASAEGKAGEEVRVKGAGGEGAAGGVLPHKVDTYGGVIIDAAALPDGEQAFVGVLDASLEAWKAAGRRGVLDKGAY